MASDEFVRPASAVFALILAALWLRETRGTAWFLVASGTISLVAGSIVWAFGNWRGWHTAMGVVGWAVSTAFWLVLLRLALRGIPAGRPSYGST